MSKSAGRSITALGCLLVLLGPLVLFLGIPLLALLGFGNN